jgi:hypothetical protein
MISDPSAVVSHLAAPQRLGYLPRLLAPLAFLPLLSWRWLIPAVPIVGINLMSEWPTTTSLDSHYQTTLLPFLVAAGIDGASRLSKQVPPRAVAAGLVTCLAIAHAVAGGTPLAADFDRGSFTADDRSGAARATVQRIPDGESVQAPYALMAHLVERELISSAPPPDKNYAWVVLDAWHRDRFRHREDLLRTHEEPNVRNWLAREDYGLVGVEPPYLILSRGADPRGLAEARGIFGDGDDDATGERLAECLWLTGAARDGDVLTLSLRASGPCGADLALRIGTGPRPARVDLLFDGFLSPAHLRAGDCVRSTHTLDPEEIEAFDAGELRVGLLRSSGARPAHEDPVAVYLSASAP